MRTLYSHPSPDPDLAASYFVVIKFIKGFNISILEFKPANWDGEGMRDGDIAIDMLAGGKGIKGRIDEKGDIHSCFESLVEKYVPENTQKIIKPLVAFIDAQDTLGGAHRALGPEISEEAEEVFALTGFNQVFRAVQTMCHAICYGNVEKGDESVCDEMTCKKMVKIFEGFVKGGQNKQGLHIPLATLIDKFSRKYPSKEDQEALTYLLKFSDPDVNVYKQYAPELSDHVREIFSSTGIIGVYGAVRSAFNEDEKEIEKKMFFIFEGMRLNGLAREKQTARRDKG